MKFSAKSFCMWLLCICTMSTAWAQSVLSMQIGEIKVIPVNAIARVAVGDSKVINAMTDDDKEVILFARSQGQTTLEVWDVTGMRKSYAITVRSATERQLQEDIRRMLSRIPNVKAAIVGEKVIVEGDRLTDADRERVSKLVAHYPQIVDMTSQVGWDEMVMLDVQILELPRNFMSEVGVKWSGVSQGGFNLGLAYDGASGAIMQRPGETVVGAAMNRQLMGYAGLNALLSSSVQAMANEGSAVVLAQPQLMARSGATAEFLAGGEVPYSVVDANGNAQTVFKPYGVSLWITPRIEKNGTIRSKINVEVSSVDTSMNLTGGPALKTRRTSTEFNVRSGETLVLSGFISRDQMNGMDKLPGAGDMPIIGELFKSRKFQNNETELVIFVRPVVVSSENPQLQARVNRSKAIIDSSFEQGPILNVEVQPEAKLSARQVDVTRSSSASTILASSSTEPKSTAKQTVEGITSVRSSTVSQTQNAQAGIERPQYTNTLSTREIRTSAWNPVLRFDTVSSVAH